MFSFESLFVLIKSDMDDLNRALRYWFTGNPNTVLLPSKEVVPEPESSGTFS